MRTLVVAELYPWPAVDGYRQRLHHLVAGLGRTGEVDVFALTRPDQPEPVPSPLDAVSRVLTAPSGPARGARDWGPEWLRGGPPRRLLALDWSAARRELAAVAGDHDLIWYSHVDAWWPTHDLFEGTPAVVDFDNLEHLALRLRRRIPPRSAPGASAAQRARGAARWAASRAFDLVDEGRWDRAQRTCASRVDHVVVCSELDVVRSGCANAVVVPNGCDLPAGVDTDRRALRGDTPTLMFVGALDYEPNTEAVEWFVSEVWPIVQRDRPDARVRIVGRGEDRVGWVAEVPGVELTGPVPDLRAELDAADVSIVPIRVGAGTRLKVVEAMAHHLPLVTTTVGCEGIELVPGTSALIADDARGFAEACLLALADGGLRRRLADSAGELFEARFTWDRIEERVADLARTTAARP